MSSAVSRRLAIIQQHLLLSSQQPFCRTTADANVRSHSTAAQLHMQGKQPKIAFIGAGQMATALAHGFITANVTAPSNIIASDVFANQRESFTINTGARTTDSNSECVRNADIVFLSVKPQVLIPVIKELREAITPQHLIVSIAAGVSIETLESTFEDRRIIRVMPNTPCLIGKSASAFSLGSKATSEDAKTVEMLLSAVGLAIQVPERLLDAVTGLSGSGPAYVYQFIEALRLASFGLDAIPLQSSHIYEPYTFPLPL